MFGFIDIILIVIVVLFIAAGFFSGFIRTLGNLVGLILGFAIGGWGLLFVSNYVNITARPVLAIVLFLVIAGLVSWLIGILVNMIEGARKLLTIIPFLGSINRLLGAILGFIEGILTLAAIAYFVQTYLPEGSIKTQALDSVIIHWMTQVSGIVSWLFPAITQTVS